MKCIVTCGPTIEPLDQVRRLTNFSTGKLGIELGNFLTANGCEVILLKGEGATYGGKINAQPVIPFSSTSDLEDKLRGLSEEKVTALFHTAAVSDFRFGDVFRPSTQGLQAVRSGKFSTRDLPLYAELVPTPKILPRLAEWFPSALRVGWKYEVDGTQDEALQKGRAQLKEARTHYSVVNGPAYGPGFGVVTADGEVHCQTADELYGHLWSLLKPSSEYRG